MSLSVRVKIVYGYPLIDHAVIGEETLDLVRYHYKTGEKYITHETVDTLITKWDGKIYKMGVRPPEECDYESIYALQGNLIKQGLYMNLPHPCVNKDTVIGLLDPDHVLELGILHTTKCRWNELYIDHKCETADHLLRSIGIEHGITHRYPEPYLVLEVNR